MAIESQKRARNKYNKLKTINKTVQLNLEKDKDIIEYIRTVPSFNGLVKELIRDKIKENIEVKL